MPERRTILKYVLLRLDRLLIFQVLYMEKRVGEQRIEKPGMIIQSATCSQPEISIRQGGDGVTDVVIHLLGDSRRNYWISRFSCNEDRDRTFNIADVALKELAALDLPPSPLHPLSISDNSSLDIDSLVTIYGSQDE